MNQRSDTLRELTHRSTFQNDRPREFAVLDRGKSRSIIVIEEE